MDSGLGKKQINTSNNLIHKSYYPIIYLLLQWIRKNMSDIAMQLIT